MDPDKLQQFIDEIKRFTNETKIDIAELKARRWFEEYERYKKDKTRYDIYYPNFKVKECYHLPPQQQFSLN